MGSLDDLVMPHESAEFIVQNAKSVTVHPEAVDKLSRKVCEYFSY